MSSVGLNKWIVSGYLAADAEIKIVDLKSGEKAKVAKATIYVRKQRIRDESFTVSLSIWEGASAWRKLPFLRKGSLIICTGSIEPNPYVSSSDNLPRAGLSMNVLDIDLDNVRSNEGEDELPDGSAPSVVISQESPLKPSGPETQLDVTQKDENSKQQQQTSPSSPKSTATATKQEKQETKPTAKV